MYHQVGDFTPMASHRSTYCDRRRFSAQMALLRYLGYRVITLDRALAELAGGGVIGRTVVLTFDDGYENFYQHAWPQLARHRFPAMVYLLSALIGEPARWFAADGRETPMLMDRARVRELRALGVQFGSHGVTHQKLAEVDATTLQHEVTASKRELEALLGESVDHFCYPYGSHNEAAVSAVEAAGYRSAVTCQRAAATSTFHPLVLPRKAISYGDSLIGFWWKLAFKNRPRQPPLRLRLDSAAAHENRSLSAERL